MNAKFVFSLALAAALPALADVTTANVVGVLRVDSSAAETIVSVPWVATSAAATDTAIPVTDIVKTAGLNIGDELYYYNSETGKYQCWRLKNGVWGAAEDVIEGGENAPANATLVRGNAIILKRTAPIQDHFFLQGQVAKTGSQVCTMTRSATGVAYSLLAPPTDTAIGLNAGTWSNVADGDYVLVQGKKYEYGEDETLSKKWGTYVTDPETFGKTFTAANAEIAVGQGAWYVSAKGSDEAATVTWNNLPTVGK